MTVLLALENIQNLDEYMTISQTAVDLPGYASSMRMQAGERITVRHALYGNLLPSGNDVARALAEHISGSVPDFVALMNRRAFELGATNARFVNPCGLPGNGQFVTAHCVAIIMQEAIRHPVFVEIIGASHFRLPPTNMYDEARFFANTNRMVNPSEEAYNPSIVGGKTGFTNAAQSTLVSYARRGDHGLIISVLYAPPRGATFNDTASLLEYGFAILEQGEIEVYIQEYIADEVPPYCPVFSYDEFNYYLLPHEEVDFYEPEVVPLHFIGTPRFFSEEVEPDHSLQYEVEQMQIRLLPISIVTIILGMLAVSVYILKKI